MLNLMEHALMLNKMSKKQTYMLKNCQYHRVQRVNKT
jgi:hypothetical protein